jgi:hypothetical protein
VGDGRQALCGACGLVWTPDAPPAGYAVRDLAGDDDDAPFWDAITEMSDGGGALEGDGGLIELEAVKILHAFEERRLRRRVP